MGQTNNSKTYCTQSWQDIKKMNTLSQLLQTFVIMWRSIRLIHTHLISLAISSSASCLRLSMNMRKSTMATSPTMDPSVAAVIRPALVAGKQVTDQHLHALTQVHSCVGVYVCVCVTYRWPPPGLWSSCRSRPCCWLGRCTSLTCSLWGCSASGCRVSRLGSNHTVTQLSQSRIYDGRGATSLYIIVLCSTWGGYTYCLHKKHTFAFIRNMSW